LERALPHRPFAVMSAGLLAGRSCASHTACTSGVLAPRVCPAALAWPCRQPAQPLAALRPGASCWPACARGAPRGAPGAGARGAAGLAAAAVAEAERPLDGEAWREASWPDAFDRHFARGDLLGRGSFGTVYRCVERATGDEEFAVKVISKTRDGVDPARILMRIREEARHSCYNVCYIVRKLQHVTFQSSGAHWELGVGIKFRSCQILIWMLTPRRWTRCSGCRRARRPSACAASTRWEYATPPLVGSPWRLGVCCILTVLVEAPQATVLKGVWGAQDAGHVYIVTELCMGGDLEQLLEVRLCCG